MHVLNKRAGERAENMKVLQVGRRDERAGMVMRDESERGSREVKNVVYENAQREVK